MLVVLLAPGLCHRRFHLAGRQCTCGVTALLSVAATQLAFKTTAPPPLPPYSAGFVGPLGSAWDSKSKILRLTEPYSDNSKQARKEWEGFGGRVNEHYY